VTDACRGGIQVGGRSRPLLRLCREGEVGEEGGGQPKGKNQAEDHGSGQLSDAGFLLGGAGTVLQDCSIARLEVGIMGLRRVGSAEH